MSTDSEPLLHIGICSWVIEDGNYDNFATGDDVKFALQFDSEDLVAAEENAALEAVHLSSWKYKITAKVLFVDEDCWVIDTGAFRAYTDDARTKSEAKAGDIVTGNITLWIDQYDYQEFHYKNPEMPLLSYRWTVQKLQMYTAPYIKATTDDGVLVYQQDESRESFIDIIKTDASKDDERNATYLLFCTMQAGPELPEVYESHLQSV